MNRSLRQTLSLIVVLLSVVVSLPAAVPPGAPQTFKLEKVNADGWTYTLAAAPLASLTVDVAGTPSRVLTVHQGLSNASPGDPDIPSYVIQVGVPFDCSVSAEVRDAVYQSEIGQDIAPVPSYRFTDEREAVAEYRRNPSVYARAAFIPQASLVVDEPFVVRGQRIAPIRVAAAQYNPATRELRRLVSAKIQVHLSRTIMPVATVRLSSPDPAFEEVFRSLVSNYEEAKQWRLPVHRTLSTSGDPTADWFVPSQEYYRLMVSNDGWYRVPTNALVAAGARAASIDTTTLKVFYRGVEIPILVRSDGTIEFYGKRNRTDSVYIDTFSDTSSYWLTWGGAPGKRFVPVVSSGPPTDSVRSLNVVAHFEQNTQFFTGTTIPEIISNSPVPGRGWVWDYFYPGDTYVYVFDIDSIDAVSQPSATLRVRLFSTTVHSSTPDHDVQFWVNDSIAGETTFLGRQESRVELSFPARWLHPGQNRLRVQSITTQAVVNQFYLDWFEVEYARALRANNDQILLSARGSAGTTKFSLSGFSGSDVGIFDMTNGRRIVDPQISPESVSSYRVSFADTGRAPRLYSVVRNGAGSPVDGITKKIFTNIRANSSGADYIIIAHAKFLAAAKRLAAYRGAQGTLRTSVIDVQDIYDEFNYGAKNGDKIKAFLAFAYQHWPSPAPANLLILGDASWDFHHNLASTIKTDFVPAYGNPAGDNWYVCFDSLKPYVPSMIVGRLPVQDSTQAERTVDKVISFDSTPPQIWDKNFMFISGGIDTSERASFNAISDDAIRTYVTPPPIGGTAFRVYKTTPNAIDGENKAIMQQYVKNGLVFINFLGHSGGRIWGVDIGSPNDLENTTGQLPFISSTSCNVGAFADPHSNVLSEDFVLADNRGASAVWASASLGYSSYGSRLMNLFLIGATVDSGRAVGALTTGARLRLLAETGPSYITVAHMNLTPLLGDPLTKFAVPLKPDLAVSSTDFSVLSPSPTLQDSSVPLKVYVHNYGVVPHDSVGISLRDSYNGSSTVLLNGKKIQATRHIDSLVVPWNVRNQGGSHVLDITLDPGNTIAELTKSNNSASAEEYIFDQRLLSIRPMRNQVLPPGPVTLVVMDPAISPAGETVGFEIDTIPSFNSPFKLVATGISHGPVAARWTTPSLAGGIVYYWRSRTVSGAVVGDWVSSSFSTAEVGSPFNGQVWRIAAPKQFAQENLQQTTASDTGVTIASNLPVQLRVRSVGYRGDMSTDFYSTIQINEQIITGYWWVFGNGFLAIRLNQFTGAMTFQPFDTPALSANADSMAAFIDALPTGDYFAAVVVFDGKTNMSVGLRQRLASLGSTLIDSLHPGDAWTFIGRKGTGGPGMSALEHWSRTGVALDSLQVPNYFSAGSGIVTSRPLPFPFGWGSFSQQARATAGKTSIRSSVLGIRAAGTVDTLAQFGTDSTTIDLHALSALPNSEAYHSFAVSSFLASKDAGASPSVASWSLSLDLPADLAISTLTVGTPGASVEQGKTFLLPVTVHNIGFRTSDTCRVDVTYRDGGGIFRTLSSARVDSIAVDDAKLVVLPIRTDTLSHRVQVQVSVHPALRAHDLRVENNVASYAFDVTPRNYHGTVVGGRIYADGIQLMEGDYVGARPNILFTFLQAPDVKPGDRTADFYIDNVFVGTMSDGAGQPTGGILAPDQPFHPSLVPGRRELLFRVKQVTAPGMIDSLDQKVAVTVSSESKILQAFNYPNPFSRETEFTFILAGTTAPDNATIRIYTVAGRKIKTIEIPAGSVQIGFNRVAWDGRDDDGGEIANGYYFYQIATNTAGNVQTLIGKIARIH